MTMIKHKGEVCPVPYNTQVVYRTKEPRGLASHIHGAKFARELDWTSAPKIGRIFEYRVVG